MTELVAALLATGDDAAGELDQRLARLPAAERERALGVLRAVLDALAR